MPTNCPAAESYAITFLFDKSNNWIESHIKDSGKFLSSAKYTFNTSHDPNEVFAQDVVFIVGYTKILSSEFLAKNRLNLVIHESALPLGKGFSPVQWQILEGKNEIPICLIEASDPVDSGFIVSRSSFTLDGYELYEDIRRRQAAATIDLIAQFLDAYPAVETTKQTGEDSFYRKRSRKDGELDIDKSIREQFNLLRIGNNEEWPSHFYIDDHKYVLKIFKSE